MAGIFGSDNTTRTITLINIGSDLLQGAFNAKLNQQGLATARTSATSSSSSAFGPDVIAPWDKSTSALDLPDTIGEHLSGAPLFARNDPDVDASGLDKNSETLFRLWKGLKKMQSLASFAVKDSRADILRPQLQAQFERYEQEVAAFISANPLTGVTVLSGPLKTEAEAESRIPRSQSTYEGRFKFSTTEDVVPGLETDTKFNINVVKADGSEFDIAIDLADMGTTEKTVANIVNHVNEKLEAAEVTTRFRTNRDEDGRVGFKVERSILETVTLTPVDSEPAIYVAGTSGNGEYAKASIRKFTDIDTDPVQSFDVKTAADEGVTKSFATALGPNGEVYTLGTTTGDIDGQVVGGEKDVFLTRYDAAGNEIWRRLVGASGSAEGLGLAVADDGSIAIAGKADKPLTEGSPDNGLNSFVTMFDADGEVAWTRHTGPIAPDAAFAVEFDDVSGDVIVVGASSGPISGETHQGGQDAYVSRLSSSSGALVEQVQFGDAGDEIATAVTVKGGVVYVAGQDDSQGFLKTFDVDDLSSGPVLDVALGDAGSTTRVSAIEVDDSGNVFVAGDTSDSTLANAVNSHSGSNDGFVAQIDSSTGSLDRTTYVGSAGSDRIRDMVLHNGEIYAVGETSGDLDGNNLIGSQDGFLTRIDATGTPVSTKTMTGINGHVELRGISVDDTGDSVLSRMGLGHGDIGDLGSLTVTSTTAVRPGMTFSIAVNQQPAKSIEIEADDSIRWLAFQINRVLGTSGLAEVKKDGLESEYIKINAKGRSEISLRGGIEGFDALPGLGLSETTIYGPDVEDDSSFFALGFGGFVNLMDKEAAEKARDHMGFAMNQIEKAFSFLEEGEKDPLDKKRLAAALEAPPAHLQKQIASYQAALTRLTGGQQ